MQKSFTKMQDRTSKNKKTKKSQIKEHVLCNIVRAVSSLNDYFVRNSSI